MKSCKLPFSQIVKRRIYLLWAVLALLLAFMVLVGEKGLIDSRYTTGLSHMETGKAAVLTFSEPVMATIISITVFGEVFTRNHAIGMIAIVTSIVLLNIHFTRRHNH